MLIDKGLQLQEDRAGLAFLILFEVASHIAEAEALAGGHQCFQKDVTSHIGAAGVAHPSPATTQIEGGGGILSRERALLQSQDVDPPKGNGAHGEQGGDGDAVTEIGAMSRGDAGKRLVHELTDPLQWQSLLLATCPGQMRPEAHLVALSGEVA